MESTGFVKLPRPNKNTEMINNYHTGYIVEKILIFHAYCRSYALSPVYETVMGMFEEASDPTGGKSDDMDSKEAILPGVNLLFDGSELRPFDIGACLQARQPVSLIVEASLASSASSGIK